MKRLVNTLLLSLLLISNIHTLYSDSFNFNTYNNHGVIGIINTPSARLHEAGSYGINIYNGTPDQKITLTSSPYDWMEASFFYMNIQNRKYCEVELDPVCNQDPGVCEI